MDSKGGDANNAVDVYPKCSSVGFIDSDVNKMYMALTAITREIQRFHYTEKQLFEKPEDMEPFNSLVIYKSRLQRKRKQIKRLNQNVKICWKKQDWELKNNILHNRDWDRNSIQNVSLIRHLAKRNGIFEEAFDNIKNHIIKGYNKIQKNKMNSSYNSDIPLLEQLKTIINECEKHKYGFCNEREKCQLLEQRNRFLQNKISILVSNMETLKKELANVSYQLSKRDKEIIYFKNKLLNKINHTKLSPVQNPRNDKNIGSKISTHSSQPNLSSHLSLVKSLLIDQDRMIKKIKNMTDIIIKS
nr:uncharacterized protein LOC116766437 isoform X2 [Danaus plexippus plexippus]